MIGKIINNFLHAIGRRYIVRWQFPSKSVPGGTVNGFSKPMFKFEAYYCAAWASSTLSGKTWVEELPSCSRNGEQP